ncbi:MAG: BspA family leucine-rich repeat surface protein [Bosea sp.]|nr:BspA family leucine-rich repeat surface protein [Bosea sp. (in: a-proteobacteria)]
MCIFICSSSTTTTHSLLTTAISPRCSFLTTLKPKQKWQLLYRPIEDWDVSEVTIMYRMFHQRGNCNPDISNWNTSSVTSFVSQFVALTFSLRLYSVEHHESKQTNTSLTLLSLLLSA